MFLQGANLIANLFLKITNSLENKNFIKINSIVAAIRYNMNYLVEKYNGEKSNSYILNS